jgi:hypothetical protein
MDDDRIKKISEFEAGILADAVGYRIHLFLGRGEFDRAEANTAAEALALGDAMAAAHPECRRQPMFYAIDPNGRSTLIPRGRLTEEKTMTIKVVNDQATRDKNAQAKREQRARAKLAATASRVDVANIKKERKMNQTKPGATVEDRVNGKMTELGKAMNEQAPKTRQSKATHDVALYGRDADRYAKALAGKMPKAPDFTADTHKPWRKKHAELGALILAGDIAALEAYAINPTTSSPKALFYWRNLAALALKAKAAKEAAKAA